jgi:uncharacterized membrane protein
LSDPQRNFKHDPKHDPLCSPESGARSAAPLVASPTIQLLYFGTVASLIGLIVLCAAWELWLAPLRPGGSWMALKALLLLLPLYGVVKRDVYTLQWSSMVILLYFTEGVVRGFSDRDQLSSWLAWGEAGLVCVYFFCAIFYLRPYKRAAKHMAADAIQKAVQKSAQHE